MPFGDSSAVQVGDSVVAIGSPFGLPEHGHRRHRQRRRPQIRRPTSSRSRTRSRPTRAINPGNSGGPLLDAAGQVLGLNDQIETNNTNGQGEGSSSGVGFATPSNSDARIANEIIAPARPHNAYVGVSLDPTVPAAPRSPSPPSRAAAPIQAGSPAAKAGLQAGDVITAVNGKTVTSINQFIATIDNYAPGDTVTLTVNRGGQTKTIKLTLGAQPANATTQTQGQNGG